MVNPMTDMAHDDLVCSTLAADVIERETRRQLLAEFSVTSTGRFQTAHGHWMEREWCVEYIVIYCFAGRGWVLCDGDRHDVDAGDLVVLPPRAHAYGADDRVPWSIYWLHLRGHDVEPLVTLAGFPTGQVVRRIGHHADIRALLESILDYLRVSHHYAQLVHVASLGRQLLTRLSIPIAADIGPVARLEPAVQLMQARLAGTITLPEMARSVALSIPHFSRLFREQYVCSPMHYFIRMKMAAACEYLSTTTRPIHEIAACLGYTDAYYFSRLFKEYIGQAPAHYRSGQRATGGGQPPVSRA